MKMSSREEQLITAATEMVGRTGATEMQVRYSDDEQPVIWMAVATYSGGRWETAAGQTPSRALYRLLEQLVDGGQCQHCGRPTGITERIDEQLLEQVVCWYQFDPELKVFRRGCEGDS